MEWKSTGATESGGRRSTPTTLYPDNIGSSLVPRLPEMPVTNTVECACIDPLPRRRVYGQATRSRTGWRPCCTRLRTPCVQRRGQNTPNRRIQHKFTLRDGVFPRECDKCRGAAIKKNRIIGALV